MKKILLILIAILLVTLFVCSCKDPVESDTDTETNVDTESDLVSDSDIESDTDSDSDEEIEDPNAFDSGLLGSDWTGPQI